jgi:hypothetical protein
MPARKNKIGLDDRWKEKIGLGRIIQRLSDHIDGKVELSNTQIQAANILLKKVAPDLASTDLNANLKLSFEPLVIRQAE